MGQDQDKRTHTRHRYGAEVRAGRLGQHVLQTATLMDVSLGGCLMRFAESADFEETDEIEVCFQSKFMSLRALGTVRRRTEQGCLIGIRFRGMSRRGLADLQDLIAMLEAESVVDDLLPMVI